MRRATAGDVGVRAPGASTALAAVIGDPVRHSLSPALHNAAFAATGVDGVFVAFTVPGGGARRALDAMRALGLLGLSVTMPHKAEVAAAADERSPVVERLGAANCIVPAGGGRLRAENTDGIGFLRGLADDAGLDDLSGRRVVVLGAGGAARAVALACVEAGARVGIANRTPDRAGTAARMVGAETVAVEAVRDADLVVDATPAGMGGDTTMACDPDLLSPGQVAVDLVYDPLVTPWLARLRRNGVEAHGGLSMLVHQAAVAFECWTGVSPPVEVMRRAVVRNGAARPGDVGPPGGG